MNIIGEKFLNIEGIKCSYGCGKIAHYKFKNGKYGCLQYYNQCEAVRTKNSLENSGIKNSMYGKSAVKYSLNDWRNKYSLLFEIGELKIENFEIFACCKKCKIWFKPKYEMIRTRQNVLIHGNKRHYFFCSEECKQTSGLYRLKYEPGDLKDYREYQRMVKLKTESTIKREKGKIKNVDLRNRYYPIDHKYSVREAFENNVDLNIVSHWKNLEIISIYENSRKNKKCSISLEKLKEKILECENE